MFKWIEVLMSRDQDQRAKYKDRPAKSKNGVLKEVALILADYTGPRSNNLKPSLGSKGCRNWTQLRACNHWSSQKALESVGGLMKHLVHTTITPDVEVDIAHVTSILSSKSMLCSFPTIAAFEARTPNHEYGDGTEADLRRCLNHGEIRCLKGTKNKGDSLIAFAWDERLLLNNNGGSHHFSAARRMAIEQKINVPLRLPCVSHVLSEDLVREVRQSLALLLIPSDPCDPHIPLDSRPKLLWELKSALHKDGVPVIPGDFRVPMCYGEGASLLPLSLENDSSRRAVDYLRTCGFTDLVEHLVEDLHAQQQRIAEGTRQPELFH